MDVQLRNFRLRYFQAPGKLIWNGIAEITGMVENVHALFCVMSWTGGTVDSLGRCHEKGMSPNLSTSNKTYRALLPTSWPTSNTGDYADHDPDNPMVIQSTSGEVDPEYVL